MMPNEAGIEDDDWLGIEWSPWYRLHPESDDLTKPSTGPGLYRVRHDVYDGLIYIGESGRSVRGRIRALIRGAFDEEMPYSDPHTASPSLWAIANEYGLGFEVSVATPPAAENDYQRKAIEDALIAVHRRETETNLVGNFGRMPPGYEKSTQRSGGARGGQSDEAERNYREGINPLPWENPEAVIADDWMGLSWSEPLELESTVGEIPNYGGVYRLWEPETASPLRYLGETVHLSNRLESHRRAYEEELFVSYAPLTEYVQKFQLQQVETELLGAHWLACQQAPQDQY
ncbi:GIY-YIG nuclease family protein [Haloquadratum walsbyi]|nr:GIY-YIG nuclease family protein [Haloquadratum walsbyi]